MNDTDQTETLHQIVDLLESGLETEVEPFPETEKEFAEIVGRLRALDPDDLKGKLVIGGFLDHPWTPGQSWALHGMHQFPGEPEMVRSARAGHPGGARLVLQVMADLIFAPANPAAVAVIACGNPTRTDDGVGAEVLRRLAACGHGADPTRVKLLDAGTDGVAVIFAARGCRQLIVVDACRSGSEPGTVFELPGSELQDTASRPLATHDFRWEDAIAAGRRIFRDEFPTDVTVFLIEARNRSISALA